MKKAGAGHSLFSAVIAAARAQSSNNNQEVIWRVFFIDNSYLLHSSCYNVELHGFQTQFDSKNGMYNWAKDKICNTIVCIKNLKLF